MRNSTQTCFIDQAAGDAADAIGFVFDTHQGFFQVIDVCDLATGHLAELLPFHAHAAVFHGHVAGIVVIATHFILAGDQSL
ncbi:MAG: hypothetical protein NVSMB63_13060 [Sediminibacterium sp.]